MTSGETNTIHCKPGMNPPFNKSLEMIYHVGIDNSQMLLLKSWTAITYRWAMVIFSDVCRCPFPIFSRILTAK